MFSGVLQGRKNTPKFPQLFPLPPQTPQIIQHTPKIRGLFIVPPLRSDVKPQCLRHSLLSIDTLGGERCRQFDATGTLAVRKYRLNQIKTCIIEKKQRWFVDNQKINWRRAIFIFRICITSVRIIIIRRCAKFIYKSTNTFELTFVYYSCTTVKIEPITLD